MKQPQAPQIISISQPKNKSAIDIILIGGAAVGIIYFGRKFYYKKAADGQADKLNTPEAQAASNIWNAKDTFNDNEEVAYNVAREIAEKGLSWKKVSDSFSASHEGRNIDEYLDFLGPEGKARFFQILNLSSSSLTKSPPGAKLQFDISKEKLVYVTKADTNVRKTPVKPEGLLSNKYLNPLAKTNVIATVKANIALGLATGKSKTDNSGTLFYEFMAYVFDGKGWTYPKVWAAASQIDAKRFKTNKEALDFFTAALKAKRGMFFMLKTYDAAASLMSGIGLIDDVSKVYSHKEVEVLDPEFRFIRKCDEGYTLGIFESEVVKDGERYVKFITVQNQPRFVKKAGVRIS